MAVKSRKLQVPLLVAGAFAAVLGFLLLPGPVIPHIYRPLDDSWVDVLFQWRGMEKADPRITVIAIDDESLKEVGHYPWPRGTYAKLFERLFEAGVRVAGVDILFPDHSTLEEDRKLVEATKKWGGNLVYSIDLDPDVKGRYGFRYPFKELREAASAFGFVDQIGIDQDGEIRSTSLVIGSDPRHPKNWPTDPDRQYSLGLKTLSIFEARRPEDLVKDRFILRLNIRGEGLYVEKSKDEQGRAVRVGKTIFGIRRIGAGRVLSGNLSSEEQEALRGGIALVGSTAKAAFDHFPSPFTDESPGVEVHATVIDNILNGRELHVVTGWVTFAIVLLFVSFSVGTAFLNPLSSTLFVMAAFVAWMMGCYYVFRHYWILQFTAPTIALLGPFFVLLVHRTLTEYEQKRFIKQTFGQFVAPEVVEDLIKDPKKIRLGGEKREMTVFFLDIAGFTSISEKMEPEALLLFLNRYLSELSGVIQKRMGVVDKYIGDCIMAFWNAPLEQKDHRTLACLAAVECQEKVDELDRRTDSSLGKKLRVRIGVNSGPMTVGLTGSERKLQYTVIGDEVNLASRLEGANKFFGSRIAVSEACYKGAKDAVEARRLGPVKVVGKTVPIYVYELLAKKGELQGDWKKALLRYEQGVDLFEKGVTLARRDKKPKAADEAFSEAKEAFLAVLKLIPDDGPSKRYLSELADRAISDSDGVFNLQTK